MVKIAVLMSTYNGKKYLEEQIKSILHQKGEFELHLIVRDDESTDNTISILERYQKMGKLKWYSGENLRTAMSFLNLIKNNCGYDYYSFSDQDDYWYEDKLIHGIEAIKLSNKPCLYFCNTEYVDKDLQSMGGNTYSRNPHLDFYSVLLAPGFLGCTMVFNSALASLIQRNSLPHKASMHDSYLAKVCVTNDGEILYDSVPHMKYRQHDSNVIGSTISKLDAIKRRIGTINNRVSIGVSEDAQEILSIYSTNMSEEKRIWIEQLANYKNNIFSAIRLCFSKKPRFLNKNMELTVRLSIIKRNF